MKILTALLVLLPSLAIAQTPRDAKVIVTVVDPSGGVIAGASVTLVGLEPATQLTAIDAAPTTGNGVAAFERVAAGRYSIQAAFPGFELGLLRDIRLNAGENRRVIVLPLKSVRQEVTVGGGQETASNRNTVAFSRTLSSDQLDALSDDPNELQRQINQLGGTDMVIRVDSFEGQQLPPKAQIKSIHVTRDQFAAETESPGQTFVDVITQAGMGAIKGGVNLSFRDGAMDGRNEFLSAGTKTPAQVRNYGFNVGGTLVKERADFSVAVNGNSDYRLPILYENTISGMPSQVVDRRESVDARNINGLLNYALRRDQTLRIGYAQQNRTFSGGVGGFDALDRAYATTFSSYGFRVLEAGPIGRRTFINSRISVNWQNQAQRSLVERPTIVVLDAMTAGGAQLAGGTHSRNLIFESDIDHVRGIHSWRAGVKIRGAFFRTDQRSNYLGTYTFSSAADYLAGRPALYSIEMGDPSFSYFDMQTGIYLQDDIRVGKALTLSPGVRYSRQTRVPDGRFAPRMGITWAPTKSGRTTLRASGGTFHLWIDGLNSGILAQSIRLDGTHQRQVIVNSPRYPDPGADGTIVPPARYLIGDYELMDNLWYRVGVDHVLSPRARVSVMYNRWHVLNLRRGRNLNPIVDADRGLRADPAFGNVIASVTDAEIRRHDIYANATFNLAAPGPASSAPRFNWRRVVVNAAYAFNHPRRNGAQPFDVPPSGTLDTEWGPGPFDSRYIVDALITNTQLRNLVVNIGINLADGYRYHETTGHDDNHDGLLNDRPAGVGLWSLRTDGRETITARAAYTFILGAAKIGEQPRYRATFYVDINNVTNHANYAGYSGIVTSPNYRRPTVVVNPRQIVMGLNLNF